VNRHLRGFMFLIITVILFSTYEVTFKLIGTRLHPLQINFYRFMIGGLWLLPLALLKMRRQKIKITGRFWGNLFILGFVNIVISMGLVQFGLIYTNASLTAVIFSSNPIFVTIFAFFILKEPLKKENMIAVITGVLGVFILFFDKLLKLSTESIIGPFLVLLSAIVFALYTVLGKRVTIQGIDSLIMTSFSFIIGSILLLPVMLVMKTPLLVTDLSIFPHILYLGILVSGVAYMCYFYGLSMVNTSAGSLVFFVKPVLATAFSVLILHETLNVYFYLGTLIILTALLVVNLKQFLIFSHK
jgi:drug/metabolite transporter (DMT)-like permease